jgi:hypothetical protein
MVGNVIGNTEYRYVWRGQGSVAWPLHTSLHRRFRLAGETLTDAAVDEAERALLLAARSAGYGSVGARQLSNVELLALLQHEGAATQFLDVTPDPFIALFFACEGALTSSDSAALVALRVSDSQVVRDLPPSPDPIPDEGSPTVLAEVRAGATSKTQPYYLWQPPPLNERVKAQRGMFLMGDIAQNAAVREYCTLDLGLLGRSDEARRVDKLLDPNVGRYISDGPPRIVIFRLSPSLRKQLLVVLAKRFGYTTQSIYPDFNGFARAHSPETVLNPGY